MTIDRIINKFKESHPEEDSSILSRAYEYAKEAHDGQLRKSKIIKIVKRGDFDCAGAKLWINKVISDNLKFN